MCACTPNIRTPNCGSGKPGCRDIDPFGRNYPQVPNLPRPTAGAPVWLIEAGGVWWTGRALEGCAAWGTAQQALQFARQADAERVRLCILPLVARDLVRTTEHIFVDPEEEQREALRRAHARSDAAQRALHHPADLSCGCASHEKGGA